MREIKVEEKQKKEIQLIDIRPRARPAKRKSAENGRQAVSARIKSQFYFKRKWRESQMRKFELTSEFITVFGKKAI